MACGLNNAERIIMPRTLLSGSWSTRHDELLFVNLVGDGTEFRTLTYKGASGYALQGKRV